jgi:hypothetical protein
LRYFQLAVWICAALMTACESREVSPSSDPSYFPLRKGLYHIYEVEEVTYTLGEPETLHYQLKTLVTDSIAGSNGQYTHILTRSRKMAGEETWEPLETWSVRKSAAEVIVSEGNVPFVVLTFPFNKNSEWNGNKYNSVINPTTKTNEDIYSVTKKGVEVSLETGLMFPRCSEILQEDNQEFVVFLDQRYEVYAEGVGLIRKEKIGLLYCNDQDRNCIGQQIVDEGTVYKQELLEYGRE